MSIFSSFIFFLSCPGVKGLTWRHRAVFIWRHQECVCVISHHHNYRLQYSTVYKFILIGPLQHTNMSVTTLVQKMHIAKRSKQWLLNSFSHTHTHIAEKNIRRGRWYWQFFTPSLSCVKSKNLWLILSVRIFPSEVVFMMQCVWISHYKFYNQITVLYLDIVHKKWKFMPSISVTQQCIIVIIFLSSLGK